MYKEDVLSYYKTKVNNPCSTVAEILGISQSAVSRWGRVIPELRAMKLQRHTRGRLRYDPTLY